MQRVAAAAEVVVVAAWVYGFAGVVAQREPRWTAGDAGTWQCWSVQQRVPGVGHTVEEVAALVGLALLADQVLDGGTEAVAAAAAVEPASEASEQGVERSYVVAPPVAAGQGDGACAAENSGEERASEQENDAPGVDRGQHNLDAGYSYRHRNAAAVAVDHGMASAAGKAAGQDAAEHEVRAVAGELAPEAGIGSVAAAVAVVRTGLGSAHRSCCALTVVVRDERQVNVVRVGPADAELVDDVVAAAVVAADVAVGGNNDLLTV